MVMRFCELHKVKAINERLGDYVGYVVASQFRNDRWVYKNSISEHPKRPETRDNWIRKKYLQKTK